MAYEETSNPLRGVEARPGSGHFGVFDHGAHVWAYTPDGQQPVLWMSQKAEFAEGSAIRGGIPVVFPWFATGPDGTQQPPHGFARLDTWHRSDLKDTLSQDGRLLVEYELDYAMDHQDFPHDYTTYVKVKFTPEYLQVAMEVTNDGDEEFHFEGALHTYLAVGDVARITLDGLDGCTYLNRADGAVEPEGTQDGQLTIDGETDRIYAHRDTVVVNDPVLGRSLEISKSGSANTIVWNPGPAKAAALTDFGDDEWSTMVCVESGNVGANAVRLLPGQTHTLKQRITVL